MLTIQYELDSETQEKFLQTSLSGKPLLTTPQLNKSTAFTLEERIEFDLLGKLPMRVESLDEQVERSYEQYSSYETRLQQNIYLSNLHDKNQVLFYKLVSGHLSDIIPTIYTPIVGTAVKKYSHEFRQPRGIYIAYPEREHMESILDNRSNPEIDLIVVTDGEGVLGIGDQGIGGMDIPVAKLMVYTLCGGINPVRTLPIFLDAGTNNGELLADPMYLGWRHKRINGQDYDDFIEQFVSVIKKKFPNAYLHWEDFGRENARKILDKYEDELCTFNDDIQGTGAVALSALMAAVNAKHEKLTDQRIVVFGAGTAGTGISDQICDAMQNLGLSSEEAHKRFWLMDRPGLLTSKIDDLTSAQKPYARPYEELTEWNIADEEYIGLQKVIKEIKPTILIGCSAVAGAFNDKVLNLMAESTDRPIIFPLSNPTERVEATPEEIIIATSGKAMIATGSPFDPVTFDEKEITIAQCNNALVFPGIGLGIIAVGATRLTKEMIWAACQALTKCSPINQDSNAPLLPGLDESPEVAKLIAQAVAQMAITQNVATKNTNAELPKLIESLFWMPEYLPYQRLR